MIYLWIAQIDRSWPVRGAEALVTSEKGLGEVVSLYWCVDEKKERNDAISNAQQRNQITPYVVVVKAYIWQALLCLTAARCLIRESLPQRRPAARRRRGDVPGDAFFWETRREEDAARVRKRLPRGGG